MSKKSVDERIDIATTKAIQENKSFSSCNKFAKYAGVGTRELTGDRLDRIKNVGVEVHKGRSVEEKKVITDEKIDDAIKRALVENKSFSSCCKFAKYAEVDVGILTEERLDRIKKAGVEVYKGRSAKERKAIIDEKMDDAIKKALLENKSFLNHREFAKYAGVSAGLLTENRLDRIKKAGVKVYKKRNNEERKAIIDEKMDDAIKKALLENKSFLNHREFAKYAGVSVGTLTEDRLERIRNAGVEVYRERSAEEKKSINDKKMNDAIKKALVENKSFLNHSEFAKYAGVSTIVLTEDRLNKIKKAGVKVHKERNNEESKAITDEKIDDAIKKALVENKSFFNHREFAKYIGVSAGLLTENRLDRIKKAGVEVHKGRNTEIVDREIDDAIKKALTENKSFLNRSEFAKYAEVNVGLLTENRLDRIKKAGVNCNALNFEIKPSQNVVKKLKKYKGHYNSLASLAKKTSITYSTLVRYVEFLPTYGIYVDTPQASKNKEFVVKWCKKQEVQAESNDALESLAKSNLGINIRISEDDRHYIESSGVIIDTGHKKYEMLESVIEENTVDIKKGKNSARQINYQCLLKGYYFEEKTIVEYIKKNHSDMHISDTMLSRLTLAREMAKNKKEVLFCSELPVINNTKEGVLMAKENTQKRFYEIWREYTWYYVNNYSLGGNLKKMVNMAGVKSIDDYIKKFPARAKVLFLTEEFAKNFESLGLNGFVTLLLYCSSDSKSITDVSSFSLNQLLSGFIAYLVVNNLAVAHVKFIKKTGGVNDNENVYSILRGHEKFNLKESALESKQLKIYYKNIIKKKSNQTHFYQLLMSLASKGNLEVMRQKDFDMFVDTSNKYTSLSVGSNFFSGYTLNILHGNGRDDIKEPVIEKNIKEHYWNIINKANLSEQVSRNYNDLFSIGLDSVVYHNRGLAKIDSSTKLIKSIAFLLEALSGYDHRFTRDEMKRFLSNLKKDESLDNLENWAIKNDRHDEYRSVTHNLYYFFFQMDKFADGFEHEYSKVYDELWKVSVRNGGARNNKRKAFPPIVYDVIAKMPLKYPLPRNNYPIPRSNKDGEVIDTSYWKLDTSPIPAVAFAALSSVPRRGDSIINMDLDEGFILNDKRSDIKSISFTKDKNKNNPKLNIDSTLTNLVFANRLEQRRLISGYVKHMQDAQSTCMVKLKDEGWINALFPIDNSKKSGTLPKEHLDSLNVFYTLMAQYEIQEMYKSGELHEMLISVHEDERDERAKQIAEMTLVYPREKSKSYKNPIDVPDNYSEFLKYDFTLYEVKKRFYTPDGTHNLRGSGATYLYYQGVPLPMISDVTGHNTQHVLNEVYIDYQDDVARKILDEIRKKDSNRLYALGLAPITTARKVINEIFIPMSKSDNPVEILEELHRLNFRSTSCAIPKIDKRVYGKDVKYLKDEDSYWVDNGLEIASKAEPIVHWEAKAHGICTMKTKCPDGINQCCALCPHLLYNSLSLDGVNFKRREAIIEQEVIGRKLNELSINKRSNAFREVSAEYSIKAKEVIAWSVLESKILEMIDESHCDNNSSNALIELSKKVTVFSEVIMKQREVGFDEYQLTHLADAQVLNLYTHKSDRILNRIENKMKNTQLLKGNFEEAVKIAKNGIYHKLTEYYKLSAEMKSAYAKEMLDDEVVNCDDEIEAVEILQIEGKDV
jgi:hypothetical protein